jgi:hypothetical protein
MGEGGAAGKKSEIEHVDHRGRETTFFSSSFILHFPPSLPQLLQPRLDFRLQPDVLRLIEAPSRE